MEGTMTTPMAEQHLHLNSSSHEALREVPNTNSSDLIGQHTPLQTITISVMAVILMVVTVTGNFLVIWSYRVNRRLRTINNMFLVSLAFSDLVIGAISMTLYPIYMITRKWWFGPVLCDIWLCVDYTLSMASVANLLLICVDRYFSVTRPFSYRARRTRSRTRYMILAAWIVSLLLWSPPIVIWPLVNGRTIRDDECKIQLLENKTITVFTAMLSFYVPVFIMTVLYGIIYRETRKCAQYLDYLKNYRPRNTALSIASMSPFLNFRQRYSSRNGAVTPPNPQDATPLSQPGVDSEGRLSVLACNNRTDNVVVSKQRHFSEGDRIALTKTRHGSNGDNVAPRPGSATRQLSTSDQSAITYSGRRRRTGTYRMSVQNDGKPPLPSSERKAARTLSAILLAFAVTWLPYNVCVIVTTFCHGCVPVAAWDAAYYLCYINSTVNPFCFALCNKTFRQTFVQILTLRACHRASMVSVPESEREYTVPRKLRNNRKRAMTPPSSS